MTSSRYLMPLPLYGSGGLRPRSLRGGLAEQLTIGAAESNNHLSLDRCSHALGQRKNHRMRKAQCHVDLLALDLGAIANAIDFKHAAKTLADTLGHIGDQLSRQPMQSRNLTLLAAPARLERYCRRL